MSLIEISEDWVKDRVKITNEKLDDIKSLSLPGTFDEKILRLGSSLYHFTRLKELDLSRNVLEDLDGLNHLQCLESLNLYYNNVASLKELYKLRNNQKLTQLDLRLNPVARNEADYRLCLIHMLPLLIRLDDRCVKDEERKAALMYFGSDQSVEFSPNKQECVTENNDKLSRIHKKINPRVEMVNRWTKGVLSENSLDKNDFNDEGLHLNLHDLQMGEDYINAPRDREIGSMKEYSRKERLDVEREINSFRQTENLSNFSTIPVYIRSDDKNTSNIKLPSETRSEFLTYKTYLPDKAHGDGFGSSVQDQDRPQSYRDQLSSTKPTLIEIPENKMTINGKLESELPMEMTDKICDLVDRHWNGSRSLHQNPKFINIISNIISSYYSTMKPNHFNDNIFPRSNKKCIETNANSSINIPNNHYEETKDLSDIKLANKALKEQIKELRQQLNISEKCSTLTELLKQSHESLITTNEQLRKQLDNQNKRK